MYGSYRSYRSHSIGDNTGVMRKERPIRVCHIAPSLDLLGGQSIQAARLLEGLKEAPEVEAELLPINPALPGPLRRLQRIKYARTVVNTLATLILLIVRLPRYDIVQVYAASYFSFLLTPAPAVLIAKLYGKRVILHYHSGEAEDHLSHWYWMAAPVIRLADVVIAPSGYLVDVFARFGLRAQAIFNIAAMDKYRFRWRRPLRPVFFTSRSHEPLYNVPCVLRAFALIQRRYPEARLTGGVPYIVKHEETGLMVERDDHEALAENAIRLLEDQELAAAIARRAREECAQYDWQRIKGQWLAVYRALVGSYRTY